MITAASSTCCASQIAVPILALDAPYFPGSADPELCVLQEAAAPGMQRAMHHDCPSGLERVAQLLSGHQTAAAAVVAASLGDVRLATLVAQVCPQLTW